MKKGWEIRRVSEIAEHSLGKMLDKSKNKGEPRRYLRNLNVRWAEFDLSDLLEMRFMPEEAAKYTVRKGDVLVCEGGYPGRAAIWEKEEPIHFQKALHRVRFHELERNRWFVYYLQLCDLEGTLKRHFNGAGIQHFTGEALAEFEIPIPPLTEQRRILAVLDEVLASLAIARVNAEKTLKSARELFESHLQRVLAQGSGRWGRRALADVCEVFADGDWIETKDQAATGIRLVQTGNIGTGAFKDRSEKARYISESTFRRLRCTEILEGDCLVSRLPHPVGRSCILPNTGERMITAVDCTIARFHRALMLPEFFVLYSQSAEYLGAISERCTGTTRSRISRANLGLTRIPVPSLTEQRRIVDGLGTLSVAIESLEMISQRKISAFNDLKKSLLQQAFSGALVSEAQSGQILARSC